MITVHDFNADGTPVPGTAEQIPCTPNDLALAISRGKYMVEDNRRQPPEDWQLRERERYEQRRAFDAAGDFPF